CASIAVVYRLSFQSTSNNSQATVSAPFWCQLLFSDADDIAMYNPVATGSPAIGDTSHVDSDRKSVLVCAPSDDTDTFLRYAMKQRRHGQAVPSGDRNVAERIMLRM